MQLFLSDNSADRKTGNQIPHDGGLPARPPEGGTTNWDIKKTTCTGVQKLFFAKLQGQKFRSIFALRPKGK